MRFGLVISADDHEALDRTGDLHRLEKAVDRVAKAHRDGCKCCGGLPRGHAFLVDLDEAEAIIANLKAPQSI